MLSAIVFDGLWMRACTEAASVQAVTLFRLTRAARCTDGTGAVMIDGKMRDNATWKQTKVVVDLARIVAGKDKEMAAKYGM
jgi:citrate lyase beta subunit